jgi:hypothetical protein
MQSFPRINHRPHTGVCHQLKWGMCEYYKLCFKGKRRHRETKLIYVSKNKAVLCFLYVIIHTEFSQVIHLPLKAWIMKFSFTKITWIKIFQGFCIRHECVLLLVQAEDLEEEKSVTKGTSQTVRALRESSLLVILSSSFRKTAKLTYRDWRNAKTLFGITQLGWGLNQHFPKSNNTYEKRH